MATTTTASPLVALDTAILLQVMSNLTYVDEICLALTSHHFYDMVKFNNMPPSTKATFKLSQLCPQPALFLMDIMQDAPFVFLMWRLAHWMPRRYIQKLLINEKEWLRSIPVKKGVHSAPATSWDHVYNNRYEAEMTRRGIFIDNFYYGHDAALSCIAKGLLDLGATRKELRVIGIPRGHPTSTYLNSAYSSEDSSLDE